MARQRDPLTGQLMMEGIKAVVSERTGSVTYRARYTHGAPPRRSFESRTFKSYDTAEAWLLEQRLDVRRGRHIEPSTMTVADYFERWFTRMSRTWSGARARTVRTTWDKHFLPYFAGVRLQAVTRPMLQQLVDLLAEDGLKGSTIRMYMTSVASLLTAAEQDGLIHKSPFWGMSWPRDVRSPRPIWSPLQLRRFLQSAKATNDPLYPLWAFLVATGCRIGEAIALQWRDVDLEAGQVWIHRTATRGRGGGQAIREGTKTDASGRTIPIDPWMVEILRDLKAEHSDYPVFPGFAGRHLKYPTVLPRWRKAVTAAKLPPIRPHDVRHSVASMMVASGVPERVVQEILGHKSILITMNTYTHIDIGQQRDGTRAVSMLLGMTSDDLDTSPNASSTTT